MDECARGRGVGRALLRFVLELALAMRERFGCVGVVVDAKRDAVSFYGTHGFEVLEVHEGQSSARPMPTAMFLSVVEIDAAKS